MTVTGMGGARAGGGGSVEGTALVLKVDIFLRRSCGAVGLARLFYRTRPEEGHTYAVQRPFSINGVGVSVKLVMDTRWGTWSLSSGAGVCLRVTGHGALEWNSTALSI